MRKNYQKNPFMSSVHYKKGRIVQRFCAPFLWRSFMICSSSSILFFGFSLVWAFPTKKQMRNVSLVCYVKYEALCYCLSGAVMSCSCTLKQQTESFWLFVLLHLSFESNKSESQNDMTVFRTRLISHNYGVRSTQHFTAPPGKTNQRLNEESLVSGELSMVVIS